MEIVTDITRAIKDAFTDFFLIAAIISNNRETTAAAAPIIGVKIKRM